MIKFTPTKKNTPVLSTSLFAQPSSIGLSDFIKHSFYLPVDVLTSKDFRVEPIQIVNGKEIAYFLAAKKESSGWTVSCEGASIEMVTAASHVGISCRKIIATGQRIMIIKIWYGESK